MGVLWEVYRVRYSLTCWISIAVAIRSINHSFDCTLQTLLHYTCV